MATGWRCLLRLSPLLLARGASASSRPVPAMAARYRPDGVRITHDPYAPGMAEKYGVPGGTDGEGFDPYADTVGPGIYGGRVKRDQLGDVVVGRQYQNHNPRPGPVYAGGGYTPVNEALRNAQRLEALLDRYPDLVNDVSTGGASPLHMCGMGGAKHKAAEILVRRGADIEALDTYGFTPLHRMASNNLAEAARVLLEFGADPHTRGACGQTPMVVAQSSAARAVMQTLQEFSAQRLVPIARVTVMNAGVDAVNGEYRARSTREVPEKFAKVCQENGWNTLATWRKLSGHGAGASDEQASFWFEAPNRSYIYYNIADGHWWLDGPDGLGVYKAQGNRYSVPGYTRAAGGKLGWWALAEASKPVPSLLIHWDLAEKEEHKASDL